MPMDVHHLLPRGSVQQVRGLLRQNGLSFELDPEWATRPLLSLVMIVKDEASSIERVLRNALPFMDQWAIYDTGSTDGTQVQFYRAVILLLTTGYHSQGCSRFPECCWSFGRGSIQRLQVCVADFIWLSGSGDGVLDS